MRALVAAVCLLVAQPCIAGADSVREGFEGSDINPAFEPCHRPENDISSTADRARSGSHSLRLSVKPTPLFERRKGVSFTKKLNPALCLVIESEAMYWNDGVERAELWEDKSESPLFGDEIYYGFSIWIDEASAPYGDFNRLVAGQWKAKTDDSPFLAQRFTGGFFHITLDVDADPSSKGRLAPETCKVLLAFGSRPPSPSEQALALNRPAQCELRLQDANNSVTLANELTIERGAYLPRPFGRWTDMVFRIKGGQDGIVQVWADGKLIATATGFIGHTAGLGQVQYFKIGPYRDPAGYEVAFYVDNLSRGQSFEDVDPSNFDVAPD
jgi:hypothetical protein